MVGMKTRVKNEARPCGESLTDDIKQAHGDVGGPSSAAATSWRQGSVCCPVYNLHRLQYRYTVCVEKLWVQDMGTSLNERTPSSWGLHIQYVYYDGVGPFVGATGAEGGGTFAGTP